MGVGAAIATRYALSPLRCMADNSLRQNVGGNLYIRNNSSFFDQGRLEKAVEQTIENFQNVGINFQSVNIDKKGIYPEFNGLDIMMLISDDFYTSGMFGLLKKDNSYQSFKQEFGFPYTENITKTNVGIISPKYLFEDLEKTKSKKHRFQMQVAELLTHEIGHGFGAAHIHPKIESRYMNYKVSTFFMCKDNSIQDQKFHPKTIEKMHDFIEKVKSGNLSRKEIYHLRDDYVKDLIFI